MWFNVGLATSGSGDTLAGIVAGLAARGCDPLRAAVWGVSTALLSAQRRFELRARECVRRLRLR